MSSLKNVNKVLGVDNIKECSVVIKQLICEFLGVLIYVALSVFANTTVSNGVVGIAFANGLLIASVIQLIGHISGGHINPAVTIGVMVAGQITFLRAFCYIIVQILGGIAGAAISYGIATNKARGLLGATLPMDGLHPVAACGIETLMTFLLVAVVLSVTDHHRGAKGLGSAPLAIGLTVTACQCTCLMYTGSLNPVKSLGPAIIMNVWTHLWIFWVGPILGGILAGLLFIYVLSTPAVDNYVE